MNKFYKNGVMYLILMIMAIITSACGSSDGAAGYGFYGIPYAVSDSTNTTNTTNSTSTTTSSTTKEPELKFNKYNFSIEIGATDSIIAYVDGKDRTNEVTFIQTNKDSTYVNAIIADGIVYGINEGTTVFTAHYDGAKDVNITVNVTKVQLPELVFSQENTKVNIGETEQITVTLNDKDISNDVEYIVEDDSIATVENGLITGLKPGTTKVTVHYDGAKEDKSFFVTIVDPTLPNLKVSKDVFDITFGETEEIKIKLNDEYVTDNLTYRVEKEEIATVDNNEITANKVGSTKVIVSLDGANDVVFTVNVTANLTVLKNNEIIDNLSINLNQEDNIIFMLDNKYNVTNDVKYKDYDEDIISIENGKIIAKKSGTTTVTAYTDYTDKDITFTVTVVGNLTISKNDVKMSVSPDNDKQFQNIKVYLNGEDVTDKAKFTVKVSDEDKNKDIFEIDKNGNITAGIDGFNNAEVTVEIEGASNTATFNVTVVDDSTSVTLNKDVLKQLGYNKGDVPVDINIPSIYTYDNNKYKITEIEQNLFNGNLNTFLLTSKLTNVTIPKSVKKINSSAFAHVKTLTTITLSDGLEVIGEKAFKGHDGWGKEQSIGNLVKEIKIPETVKVIERGAFEDMYHLEKINLPKNLQTLGEHAFRRCYALQAITIPNYVQTIEPCTFSQDVYRPNYTYPTSSADTYPTSLETVIIGENVTEIKDKAFYQCVTLKKVVLGSNVKTIGKEAFYGCTSLEEIVIPKSVETIDDQAFEGCTNLNIKFE